MKIHIALCVPLIYTNNFKYLNWLNIFHAGETLYVLFQANICTTHILFIILLKWNVVHRKTFHWLNSKLLEIISIKIVASKSNYGKLNLALPAILIIFFISFRLFFISFFFCQVHSERTATFGLFRSAIATEFRI